jgi:hypothetical protein
LDPIIPLGAELSDWYQRVQPLSTSGLPQLAAAFNGSDLDEMHNRIIVWYGDEEARSAAQKLFLEEIDAPPGVILALFRARSPDD